MIIIKISELPKTKEELKERTRRAWKRNPQTLSNETELITLHRGKILGAFDVLDIKQDEIDSKRVAFIIQEKISPLVGERVEYKTSNPCTTVELKNLKFI